MHWGLSEFYWAVFAEGAFLHVSSNQLSQSVSGMRARKILEIKATSRHWVVCPPGGFGLFGSAAWGINGRNGNESKKFKTYVKRAPKKHPHWKEDA